MRLYKVVILANLAFGLGLLAGYLWWERDVDRLRRQLSAVKPPTAAQAAGERSWSVRGIVRGFLPEMNLIVITHEPIPGLMGSMTMGFRAGTPSLLRGLTPGDRIEFTLKEAGSQLVVVALRKEASP